MAFEDMLYADWKTLAILAAAGSVLASIMLIMFSRLFDLRTLEQSAKAEFVFAASTVFIVLFVMLKIVVIMLKIFIVVFMLIVELYIYHADTRRYGLRGTDSLIRREAGFMANLRQRVRIGAYHHRGPGLGKDGNCL